MRAFILAVTGLAIGVAACGSYGTSTIEVENPTSVAAVSVSPAAASLQLGATTQLSAVTRDANGNVLTGRPISWTSGNTAIATVSASGLVTAVASGNVSITASSEGQTGSAALTVSAPPPAPVASVSVSPATATAQVGGTVQFSAVTRDANSNILTGRSIAWSSNNLAVATVSASGLATAVAAGSAQIRAASESQSGSATLTVTSPPPPPPPPPSGWRGNEPAGMTKIDERQFATLTEAESPHVPFWFRSGGSIVTDATAPQSPQNVMRATFLPGDPGGTSPSFTGVEAQGISYKTLYVTWWGKYSANFYGHISNFNKQVYFGANGPLAGQVFFAANGAGTAPLSPVMDAQPGFATDGLFPPNLVPAAVVPRNQWFMIEVVLVGNTAGGSDGTMDWYLNGVHVGNRTGLKFTTAATSWDRIDLDPVWGGAGGTVPVTMTFDTDHVYISGKN